VQAQLVTRDARAESAKERGRASTVVGALEPELKRALRPTCRQSAADSIPLRN
jgi:hypothetical protein